MSIINPTIPSVNDPRGSEEIDLRNALIALLADYNGNINADNIANGSLDGDTLAATLRAALGANSTGIKRRGKVYNPSEQTRTNASYGLLPGVTTDKIEDVTLEADGKMVVDYRAMVKESVAGSAAVAIFLHDGTTDKQLEVLVSGNAAPLAQAAALNMNSTAYAVVRSCPLGLIGVQNNNIAFTGFGTDPLARGVAWPATANARVGMWLAAVKWNGASENLAMAISGGSCEIDAPAGVYDVSVQYLAGGGATVTAKERLLRVEAIGYT